MIPKLNSIMIIIFLGALLVGSTASEQFNSLSNKNVGVKQRNLKGKKSHHLHSNDWYEYEDELIIVIETDDDRKSADHHGKKKGKSGKKSSTRSKGGKNEKQSKGKSRKGRDDDDHHPAKKKPGKKSKKSNKYDGWYYLDDHWYILDEDDDKVPSGPSKGRPSTPSNPSKGRPTAPSNKGGKNPTGDDNDDKYHRPPSKYTKEPTQGKKKNPPSKKTKSPTGKNKKSPTKETKSPTDNKKQNPTKQTKSPVNNSKQPPTTVGHPPSKRTSSPTIAKKNHKTKTKSPSKTGDGVTFPTTDKKNGPITKSPSVSGKKVTKAPSTNGTKTITKAPKAPNNGGAKAKCPKGNIVDGTKVIIDYEYEVVIDDKRIQDERGVKDVLKRIEDKMIQILSRDLVACSSVRALSSQAEERNLEERRRLVELLELQPTRNTATLNENTCVQGWTGDSCSVKAIGEVEATVDGRSVDSIICSILDSISNFFENNVDVKGVKDVRFTSTSNDSCKEGNFNKSSMIEKQWGGSDGVAWWIIMIILISIILLLYTFCMVLRRRRNRNYGLEKYEEVHNGDATMGNRIPHPLLYSRSSDIGEQSFPTIDVKHCSSALCNSCGSEESNDMNWVKTDMKDSRV